MWIISWKLGMTVQTYLMMRKKCAIIDFCQNTSIYRKKILNFIRGCEIICDWSEYIGGSFETQLTQIAH